MKTIGRRTAVATFLLAIMSVSSCAQFDQAEARAKLAGAGKSVDFGDYGTAESLLSEYVYRDEHGALQLHSGLNGSNRKHSVDTVVRLLWETGRDETLLQFAGDYLSGKELRVTNCRVAERQARFEDAYTCWNELGEIDRAERVLRTHAAVKLLAQP